MKVGWDCACPADRNRPRQEAVDAAHPGHQVTLDWTVQVNHLAGRMRAGVGASGAHDRQLLPRESVQSGLHGVLDSGAVRLSLPAREMRAVVLQAQGDAHNVR